MRDKIVIFINLCLFLLICGTTYAWMLTEPQVGENLKYERDMVITSSYVTVEVFEYINNAYTLITDSPFSISNVAPGVNKQFKFEITNDNNFETTTDVIIAGITGDITELQNYLTFNTTSPSVIKKNLNTDLVYNAINDIYYIKFINDLHVPAGETISIYWYATLDYRATNEVANKQLNIDHFVFLKP